MLEIFPALRARWKRIPEKENRQGPCIANPSQEGEAGNVEARSNVVTSFLKAAVPLTKIDSLQELSFTMTELSYPSILAVAKKMAGDNQAQVPILMTQSRG